MTGEEIRTRIESFLVRHLRSEGVGRDCDIFGLGLVTSLFALQLVEFVEGEFSLMVETEDLELDNFRSVDAIAQFVERKRAPSRARDGKQAP